MKIVDGTWSLVIVGKWNRHILTPTWVAENLFNHQEITVEYPINNPELPTRFRSPDNIVFVPAVHRIQFVAQEPYEDEQLRRICSMSRKLVKTLSYTPVTGLGVNFVFEENAAEFEQLALFDLLDSRRVVDNNYEVHSTEIKRQLNKNGSVLNFVIKMKEDRVVLDFNFHYEVSNTDQLVELITDELLIENKTAALGIAENIYNLQLDAIEEDGDVLQSA